MQEQKVSRLPRENNARILTRCHTKRENLSLWDFEASKRAFRARLPRLFTRLKLRIDDFFCEFFLYFKAIFTKLQIYSFLRGFRKFSRQSPNAAPAKTFDTASCLRSPDNAIHEKKHFGHAAKCCAWEQVRNDTLRSFAPAMRKRHACIDAIPKYCACHAKHKNDLPACDLEMPKRAFRARLLSLFTLWKKWLCRTPCVPPIGNELPTTRRRDDDPTTTTQRRHGQHDPGF